MNSAPEPHPLRELYGALEQAAGIGTWRFSFATKRLTWSAGVYDLLGLARFAEPASPALFDRYVHPADASIIDNLGEYLETVSSFDREFRILRPDGRTRWLAHKGEVFFNSRGERIFASGILIDISRLKEATETRKYAEDKLSALATIAKSFTWVILPDGKRPPSAAWSSITGQTPEETAGSGWLNAVYEADREHTIRNWQEALDNKTPYLNQYRLYCRDGTVRRFIVRCVPVLTEDGMVREWFGYGFDVSDVKDTTETPNTDVLPAEIGGALLRGARALLDWPVETLANASGVSVSTIRRLEASSKVQLSAKAARKVVDSLRAHGVDFMVLDDGAPCIRPRPTSKSKTSSPGS